MSHDDPFRILEESALREEAARREDLKRRGEIIAQADAAERARSVESSDQFTRENNRKFLMREYQMLGLSPIGSPPISVELALQIGWRIERVGDQNVWVRPEARPAPAPREEYHE